MKKVYYLFIVVAVFVFQGCATIIKGSKQNINITSYPAEATITINGKMFGKTPTVARVFRKDNQYVKIELDGYKTYETVLKKRFNGWLLGNIVFGGLVGIAIDAVTGSMYSLTPDQVNAKMASTIGQVYKEKDGIYFAVVLEPEASWKKIGELEKIK
jgi:hypothetical protein